MLNNDMNRLFAEGGINQQGGTKDPVSGNDVPPGALQNEVRDDIPAKLSEGEFVIPADVVRYIGLERLMKLRDEAKAGLARMNEIGQMGNADQVENPEALHGDEFGQEIDDIMSEVDSEGGDKHFAGGGVVYVPPADKDILAQHNIQRTSISNPALDVRMLKNAAGDTMYMTYFNGRPAGNIPAGYSVVDTNPTSNLTGTAFTTTGSTGSTVKQNTSGIASVDSGNTTLTTGGNNTSMTDLNLANVAVTGKNGSTTTTTDTGTTGGNLGVNSYGGTITSSDTGSVSTGAGGFTLNPDGTVSANTVNKGLTIAAGLVNPVLGIASRINNALATSSAKDFTRSIADTMGTNVDTTTAAATAGPTSVGGTGGSAASAAADAAAAAKAMGLSDAAAGAASQAAADAIVRGKSASEAAQAGSDAASEASKGEKTSTEILGDEERQAATRDSLGGWNELSTGFSGGGAGGGGKYFDDGGNATMAMAKGGLVTKRSKKSKK